MDEEAGDIMVIQGQTWPVSESTKTRRHSLETRNDKQSGRGRRCCQNKESANIAFQPDQDLCMAIYILLGNFAVLLGNFKFQTII